MEEEDGKGKRGVQKINLSEADKVRENAAKERNLGLSLNIMKTTFMQSYTYLYLMKGGEEGQPHQSLVRTTFSLFSRPSHLGILVLRLVCVTKFPILEDKTIS